MLPGVVKSASKKTVRVLDKATKKRSGDTREQILDAAEDLLLRRSYNAFSYQHISVQLGIRNAAIHYHFPSKADLGAELIKRYRERFSIWIQQLEDSTDDAWKLLQGYFQLYAHYLEAEGGSKACPSGVLGIEFGAIPDQMKEETRMMLAEIYEWLISVLQRGRETGRLQFCGTVEGKAIELGCALQGALQIARCTQPSRFHQVLEQLEADLKPC